MLISTNHPGLPARAAWQVVAASMAGRRHRRNREPCQDVVRWVLAGEGLLLAAVADGAGSAPRGEAGAAMAATAGLAALQATLGKDGTRGSEADPSARLREALESARRALEREAAGQQVPLGEYATTLLLCVAGRDGVSAAQVGDGAVVVGNGPDDLRSLTRPAVGEYLNETVFLTSEGALARIQTGSCSGRARQVVLFSDGLQMLALKMPQGEPHRPFFQPLLAWLGGVVDPEAGRRELEGVLSSDRFSERTDDDLTLLLAERRE